MKRIALIFASVLLISAVPVFASGKADSTEQTVEKSAKETKKEAIEVIRVLLEAGADVNSTDEKGNTILMECVQNYEIPIKAIKLLLEYGADPNLKNQNGETAITLATQVKNSEILKLLLSQCKSDYKIYF